MRKIKYLNGFLGINKPRGISSAAVVNCIKKMIKAEYKNNDVAGNIKIGHMGTLDVDADGVLVVALGKAPRLFDYFLIKNKTYESDFKFGVETDTLDSTGNIIREGGRVPSVEEILNACKIIEKQKVQVPPNFSAININGQRAYSIARAGNVEFELPAKPVQIHEMKLIKKLSKEDFSFRITCSSGTYIRAVCRDISRILTTYGITTRITRTISGVFNISNCLELNDINYAVLEKNIISFEKVIKIFSEIELENSEYFKLRNGLTIKKKLEDDFYFIKNENEIKMLASCKDCEMKIKINLEKEF